MDAEKNREHLPEVRLALLEKEAERQQGHYLKMCEKLDLLQASINQILVTMATKTCPMPEKHAALDRQLAFMWVVVGGIVLAIVGVAFRK